MNATLKQLAEEALRLVPAERAELADFLVASLDASEPDEIQLLWLEEASRRLAQIRSGQVTAVPGDEVLAEARALVKRS
jgi:putative addiction module component (TIGR02574 family)